MRKGIFIPDITVEMFRNASLESVEELLVSGTMEDIEITDRPHGEWIECAESIVPKVKCSRCGKITVTDLGTPDFCQWCGSDNRKEGEKNESDHL